MHRGKTSICCFKVRRDAETGKLGCGCRWPRLFDFTTDSWRSKIVAVLIFATVYVQLGVLILGYIGVSPENYIKLDSPYQCLARLPSNAPVESSNPNTTSPIEPVPIAPPVATTAPTGIEGSEWVVALAVVIIVGLMLTGVSSRQHISITIFSFLVILATTINDIVSGFYALPVSIPQIFKVLSMPDGWYCNKYAIPTLTRLFMLLVMKICICGFFFYYFVSRYLCGRSGRDYDEWRLRKAFELTRRLANPIPRDELPKKPRPYLSFLFNFECCQRSLHPENAPLSYDTLDAETYTALDLDSDSREVGLLTGSINRGSSHIGPRSGKRSCRARSWQRIKRGLREAWRYILTEIENLLTPATPTIHSLFEKKNDSLYSSRVMFSLGTCITFMLLVSTVVLGVLLNAADRFLELVQSRLVDRLGLPSWIIDYADIIANDIRLGGILACSAGFGIVLVVSLLTLKTYKTAIYSLRQGKKPFKTDPTTYNASFYVGHQLSHFLLSFFICIVVVSVLYLAGRLFFLFQFIRTLAWRAFLSVGVPFLVNFGLQFILKLIFSSWGGRNIRFRFLFQFVDVANTTVSTLTTILPSITRILTQLALQLLLCARLDIPSMFPMLDSAHGSFIAMIYEDHFNNNPVKLVFVDQIAALAREADRQASNVSSSKEEFQFSPEQSRRMRRKWRLAILLTKYPQLQKERKLALKEHKAFLERNRRPLQRKSDSDSVTLET
eukprot:TRINITY_DN1421_c0_g2_i1.p1 TRINITY_DN1421_c0_g2~~TRINITY_DN1421_c0_g2_i1.p1  ORF type:complete len:725 (+),score=71.45 TRINITY_DN1421_c0_g2_i1:40-2214(+)